MVKKIMWMISLVGLVLISLGGGVGWAGDVQGVSDTEIRIGTWAPQTGPAAPWGAVSRGTEIYGKMLNAEGGINGRKVKVLAFDDQYNPAKTKAGVKEIVDGEGAFAFVAGTGTACGLAVRDYLVDHGIIWLALPNAWSMKPDKLIFFMYPNYLDEASMLMKYAVEKMGKKKIAFFYQNDDYGKGGLKGAKRQLKKYKMELAAEIPVEAQDRDLRSHAMRLKTANPDAVVIWVNPMSAVIMRKTAAAMKFNPTWMAPSTLSDAGFMDKITGGLWAGTVFSSIMELPDSDNPLVKKYRAAFEKFGPKNDRWSFLALSGFGFAEPLIEALKRAGRDLTREKVIKELESMKDFKGIFGKISFTAKDHQGAKEVFIAQALKGGKSKRLSDWMTVDQ
jgi:branched-chain amino acid transport system substrate-binding protein